MTSKSSVVADTNSEIWYSNDIINSEMDTFGLLTCGACDEITDLEVSELAICSKCTLLYQPPPRAYAQCENSSWKTKPKAQCLYNGDFLGVIKLFKWSGIGLMPDLLQRPMLVMMNSPIIRQVVAVCLPRAESIKHKVEIYLLRH